MKKIIFFITVIVVFAGLIIFRGYQQHEQQNQVVAIEVPRVKVINPVHYEFKDSVSFTAEIKPENKAAVVCKVPGKTVLRVNMEEGDLVKAGDVLAEVDDSLVKQDMARVKALLSKAVVQYETLKSDLQRMKNLMEEEVISQQRFDHVQAEYRAASSQLKEARASLEQLEIMLGYHKITAPVAGVISRRNIDPGDTASPQSPAFLIYQQQKVRVTGAVPEAAFLKIKKDQLASITVDALPGKLFQASVSRLAPCLDPVTRTGKVEVFLVSEGVLKPGIFARVSINTGVHEGLALPRDVIRSFSGTGEFQFFVLNEGKSEQKIVKIGNTENNMVEIPTGLSIDDRVIATITDKLRDGMKVEVFQD